MSTNYTKDTEIYLTIKDNQVAIFWSEDNQGWELRINNVVIGHFSEPESANVEAREIIEEWQ
jgi:hypothetical protein